MKGMKYSKMASIDGLKCLINFDVQNYLEVKNRRKMFELD